MLSTNIRNEPYDLSDKFDDSLYVLSYTVSAMRESGFKKVDIDNYLLEATRTHNSHLLDVSIEYINMCNDITHAYKWII